MTRSCVRILPLLLLWCWPVYAEEPVWQLKMGYDAAAAPDIEKSDIQVSMQFWVEEIGQQADLPIVVKIYHHDTDQMVADFNTGQINFLFTTPLNFVRLFDRELLADGFNGSMANRLSENLLLLTRKNSGSDRLADLRGKRVSLLAGAKVHEIYLEVLCRETFRQACAKVLQLDKNGKNSSRQVLDLFFGKADAAVVYASGFDLMAELNPQVRRNLQIIDYYPSVLPVIGFFHAMTPKVFRDRVIEVAENLDQYSRGNAILQVFRNDRLVRNRVSDLEPVERLYQRYRNDLR